MPNLPRLFRQQLALTVEGMHLPRGGPSSPPPHQDPITFYENMCAGVAGGGLATVRVVTLRSPVPATPPVPPPVALPYPPPAPGQDSPPDTTDQLHTISTPVRCATTGLVRTPQFDLSKVSRVSRFNLSNKSEQCAVPARGLVRQAGLELQPLGRGPAPDPPPRAPVCQLATLSSFQTAPAPRIRPVQLVLEQEAGGGNCSDTSSCGSADSATPIVSSSRAAQLQGKRLRLAPALSLAPARCIVLSLHFETRRSTAGTAVDGAFMNQ